MFQTLRDRFSMDDAAKAEKKARKAETAGAKRRDLKAQRRREALERERHVGGGTGMS